MLKGRLLIDTKDIEVFSGIINNRLLGLECVQKAQCIMAYYSYKNEPNLLEFIRVCLDMGKCVALPYIVGEGDMIAVDYHADSVIKSNIYGIPEPVMMNESEKVEPDVVIIPGIAFDKNRHRIGFGGGYYDRFLSEVKAVKIGVCFNRQIIDDVFPETHDVPMDIVVTEDRVIGAV